MAKPSYTLAFFSDTHLGYSAYPKTHPGSGINLRVRDGYLALKETIDGIIEYDVDAVIHGGDIFHRSHPQVADIVWGREQFVRLYEAGIPVYGNTGNHDASSDRGKAPATQLLHDASRNINFIVNPYKHIEIADGINLHMISHYGLAQQERLIPEPVEGEVNLLSAHGVAMIPGHEIFTCADSPAEQPIGIDILGDPRYQKILLGHYHGMDEVMKNVWYAGSSLRRGFSDPAGGRGWLLVKIYADGNVEVEQKYIRQRPQEDLPVIDASNLSGEEVQELIVENIKTIDPANAIVRQIVSNCNATVKRGVDEAFLSKMMESALKWDADFRRPKVLEETHKKAKGGVSNSMRTAGSADLPTIYSDWIEDYAEDVALGDKKTAIVAREGARHLRAASNNITQQNIQANK